MKSDKKYSKHKQYHVQRLLDKEEFVTQEEMKKGRFGVSQNERGRGWLNGRVQFAHDFVGPGKELDLILK